MHPMQPFLMLGSLTSVTNTDYFVYDNEQINLRKDHIITSKAFFTFGIIIGIKPVTIYQL